MIAVAIELSMIVEMTSLTPAGHLQHARDARPEGADRHRDEDDQRDLEIQPGERQRAADDGGDERRDAVLAVDADVEQVHPEADGHRDAPPGSTSIALLRM